MCSTTAALFSMVLWDTWMQDPLAIRARWCADPSGWQPLKLGCYMCGPNPCFSGRSWVLGFPFSSWDTVPGVGVIGRVCLRLSYLFPCEYFLSCSMWRSQSNIVSGFFSEGIAPHIALYFVLSLEEGNSGDSYVTILVIITLLFPLFKWNWKNVEYPSFI